VEEFGQLPGSSSHGGGAVKDPVLTRRFNALVHAAAEPGIRMTYERGAGCNPAQAAGIHVVSSSEMLIHQAWLPVIGWAFDGQPSEQRGQIERLQENLARLLPS